MSAVSLSMLRNGAACFLPGTRRISGGTGGVRLYSGGTDLTGEVSINGQGLEEMIEAIVARALAASAAGGGGHGA